MKCEQSRLLLHPYLDGELDVVQSLQIVEHLGECPSCDRSREQMQALRKALANAELRTIAPIRLRDRVRSAIVASERPRPFDRLRHRSGYLMALAVAAAVGIAAIGIEVGKHQWLRSSPQVLLAADVTSAHVRSLMVNHLVDVPSSDRHTVKPWFMGKLDFAPPVFDLSEQGFALVGGRLDVLEIHPVAAVVYRRRQHVINAFVWPTSETATLAMAESTERGYVLLHWTGGGRVCWVISDLNAKELHDFASAFRQRLEQASGG